MAENERGGIFGCGSQWIWIIVIIIVIILIFPGIFGGIGCKPECDGYYKQ